MSVRFNAAEPYVASTGLPGTGDFTALCWVRLAADRNTYSTAFSLDADAGGDQLASVQTDSNGTTWMLWAEPTAVDEVRPGLGGAVGAWMRVATVRSGDTLTVHVAAAAGAVSSASGTLTGELDVTMLRLGASPSDSEWLNGNLANFKLYSTALDLSEIETEWGNWQAQRLSNLLRHHRFRTAAELTDYSGNGHLLTLPTGSPAFESTNPVLADSPPGGGSAGLGDVARVGGNPVASLRVGSSAVSRLYRGSTQVWSAS